MTANLRILLFLLFLTSALSCDAGSFQVRTGVCQQCDISCNTCKSSDGCSTCYDQMYLVAKGNLVVCDVCYKVNKGCDICLTASKCQNCSAGYFLQNDNTCESCGGFYPNCLLCHIGNLTQCVSCKHPFQLINGQCVSNGTAVEQQSVTEDAPTTAVQPQDDTVSDSAGAGMTVGQAYQAVMGVSSTQQAASSSCDASQVSVNGICYPAIAFCSNYSQTNGSCIACSMDFVLNNGYCLPSSLVAQTQTTTATQTTSTITTNPTATTKTTTTASAVKQTCSNRQYLRNGVCNDVGAQCLEFDSQSGKCYLCASGFSVFNGLCIQQAPPTSSASSSNNNQSNSNQSHSNQSNYNQQNSSQSSASSAQTLPHCDIIDPSDSSHCLVCVSGYTIVDELPGVCFQIN